MKQLVILGGGVAGLSAAYHARKAGLDYALYEKNQTVGGLCRTERRNGFSFDYSGHLLHLKQPCFRKLVRDLLGENLLVLKRKAFIYSHGVFTPYPFQANLFGLPPEVIKECLLGFIKAFYESEDLPTFAYPNFREWILAKLGEGIGKHFMFPYNEKVWTVPTEKLTCEWLSDYVPRPSLEDVLNGSFGDQNREFGYNAEFWYPREGGIQVLCDALAERVPGIRLGERAIAVDAEKKTVTFESGRKVAYHRLISSIPVKFLVEKLIQSPPRAVRQAAAKLKHNSVLVVNLGVRGEAADMHWIYIPEKKYTAYRIGAYSRFSGSMAPPGMSSYYMEIAYRQEWDVDKTALVKKAVDEMMIMDLFSGKEDIVTQEVMDIPCAYVVYDKEYASNRKIILDYLASRGIYSIGRYGSWEYSGMEEAMHQGKKAVHDLIHG